MAIGATLPIGCLICVGTIDVCCVDNVRILRLCLPMNRLLPRGGDASYGSTERQDEAVRPSDSGARQGGVSEEGRGGRPVTLRMDDSHVQAAREAHSVGPCKRLMWE